MAKPLPVKFDGTAKYWMYSTPTCHTPLVLEEDYCGKLYRIQVPREKVGELYQSGRFVLKMENVCFNDGSHILENTDAEYLYKTTPADLTKEPCSMLAAMFSGNFKFKEERGYILIDRDGSYFAYMLKWLRDERLPILEQDLYP
ncbi:hypothetical protein M0R45_017677 [Rubus argutus]|uniref:Potassium channel tetramerisation-type BTB domain-containing protein n=1 Tax=Rubus argutus TaxID=59490 RepID=A0AAW1XWL1_RUBAR